MPPEQNQNPNPQPPSPLAPQNITGTPFGQKVSGINDMLEPDEQLVTVIRRHPIGIIGYYLEVFIGLIIVIIFFVMFFPTINKGLSPQSSHLIIAGALFAATILVFFLFVATYVYRQCRLLLTDRSLVQVIQTSLFSRKVSRLSLSNVEDVTAESQGFLPSIFGYGTLFIQTAGTLDNFRFIYCPTPSFFADQIIEARQRYAQSLEEERNHPADVALRGQ